MAKEPVLKTGARKRLWVRVPPPPLFPNSEVITFPGGEAAPNERSNPPVPEAGPPVRLVGATRSAP